MSAIQVTGNRGEWSELYALVKLLSIGKLYAADENIQPLNNFFFEIIKILRNEKDNNDIRKLEFIIKDSHTVNVFLNGEKVESVSREQLMKDADVLFEEIALSGSNSGSFVIPISSRIMNYLHCSKIKASSADKSDMSLLLHDTQTSIDILSNFSIKSELGSSATLLNASEATNFIYEIKDLPADKIHEINSINTRSKIKDRIIRIYELGGRIDFLRPVNETFSRNLELIDGSASRILAEALLLYFKDNVKSCKDICEKLDANNPLRMNNPIFYSHFFRKFLAAVALGLMPSSEWNGYEEANGGYIIVTKDGQVLAFHIYNRDIFMTYLLNHTRFESSSTSRHHYAQIYSIPSTHDRNYIHKVSMISTNLSSVNDNTGTVISENNRLFINLNLQIRFQ